MDRLYLVGAIITLALMAYLFVALLYPERFE
jgi:K+-transporting ATPase KdpF subunit